jgi:hypothetical protein
MWDMLVVIEMPLMLSPRKKRIVEMHRRDARTRAKIDITEKGEVHSMGGIQKALHSCLQELLRLERQELLRLGGQRDAQVLLQGVVLPSSTGHHRKNVLHLTRDNSTIVTDKANVCHVVTLLTTVSPNCKTPLTGAV